VRVSLRSLTRRRRLALVGALWLAVLLGAQALLTRPVTAHSDAFPPRWATHTDRTLSRAVDSLARRRGSVVWCWSTFDWRLRRDPWRGRERLWKGPWGGYTLDGAVELAPNECVVLKLLVTARPPVWQWQHPEALAWSTYVLAHESVHVSGYRSEQKATCWGLQRVDRAARALGRTAEEGRYLAKLAWKTAYPRARPSYRSQECRDGGRLDLHPNSHIWP
jgi:hypothetical protein